MDWLGDDPQHATHAHASVEPAFLSPAASLTPAQMCSAAGIEWICDEVMNGAMVGEIAQSLGVTLGQLMRWVTSDPERDAREELVAVLVERRRDPDVEGRERRLALGLVVERARLALEVELVVGVGEGGADREPGARGRPGGVVVRPRPVGREGGERVPHGDRPSAEAELVGVARLGGGGGDGGGGRAGGVHVIAAQEPEVRDHHGRDAHPQDQDELALRQQVSLAGLVDEVRHLQHGLVYGQLLELHVNHQPEGDAQRGQRQADREQLVPVDAELTKLLYKPGQWQVTKDVAEHDRRTVYLMYKRNLRLPFMEVFDAPDMNISCARRESSTHAPQALELLNGDFANSVAKSFAARLDREAKSPAQQVELAYRLAAGRAPNPKEKQAGVEFLKAQPLSEFAIAVLNLNAFLYVN